MINLLNGLKEKYPSVTYADMYQLASALAIEVGSLGLVGTSHLAQLASR